MVYFNSFVNFFSLSFLSVYFYKGVFVSSLPTNPKSHVTSKFNYKNINIALEYFFFFLYFLLLLFPFFNLVKCKQKEFFFSSNSGYLEKVIFFTL